MCSLCALCVLCVCSGQPTSPQLSESHPNLLFAKSDLLECKAISLELSPLFFNDRDSICYNDGAINLCKFSFVKAELHENIDYNISHPPSIRLSVSGSGSYSSLCCLMHAFCCCLHQKDTTSSVIQLLETIE